jgi:hypothetical protein
MWTGYSQLFLVQGGMWTGYSQLLLVQGGMWTGYSQLFLVHGGMWTGYSQLFLVHGGMWTQTPPCTTKTHTHKYMIFCHNPHNNGICIILTCDISQELNVLPDDMRCAINTCKRSSESVLM